MPSEQRLVLGFLGYCTVIVGIVSFTKYKIAKMDWANARAMAETVKEATAR